MVLYQTVSDRDNADYIEDNAPFRCERKDAWLGEGYYFWDTLIKNAHWWCVFRSDSATLFGQTVPL